MVYQRAGTLVVPWDRKTAVSTVDQSAEKMAVPSEVTKDEKMVEEKVVKMD